MPAPAPPARAADATLADAAEPARAAIVGGFERAATARGFERAATARGFATLACLLAGTSLLRPVRESLGLDAGVAHLPWLFSGTFVVTLLALPAWGWACVRLRRASLAPLAVRALALLVLAIAVTLRWTPWSRAAGTALFIGVSVGNALCVSAVWSLLVDLFRAGEAARRFGLVAAGASAGALAGPALAAVLAPRVGVVGLLLLAAACLDAAARASTALARRLPARDAAASRPLGGTVLAGLVRIAASPTLRRLALYVILLSGTATVLYFQQGRLVTDTHLDRDARTALFARLDLAANLGALLLQTTVTGRLLPRWGVSGGLLVVPLVSLVGGVALATMPVLAILAVFQVARRATEYALARPARELCFTALAADDKYKAKSVVDTALLRGADALWGWVTGSLFGLGLGVSATALGALPLSTAALGLGLSLDRTIRRRQEAPPP